MHIAPCVLAAPGALRYPRQQSLVSYRLSSRPRRATIRCSSSSAADGNGSGDSYGERCSRRKQLQNAVDSLLNQAGTGSQNFWSVLQQRAATVASNASAALRKEQQAAATSSSADSNAVGSVQQDGQSQMLSFRSTDSNTEPDRPAVTQPAFEMMGVPTSSSSSSIDDAAHLLSWDAPASVAADGSPEGDGSSSGGTDWGADDLEAPSPAPWRLAGNLLFASLLVGMGMASALALRRYGSWRQQHLLGPTVTVGNVVPPAGVAMMPARPSVPPAHGNSGDGSSAEGLQSGTAHCSEPGDEVKQWGAYNSSSTGTSSTAACKEMEQPTEEEASPHISPGDSSQHEEHFGPAESAGAAPLAAAEQPAAASVTAAGEQERHSHQQQQSSDQQPQEQQQWHGNQQHEQYPSHNTATTNLARKYPIRTPEGAAALDRMRRLQQRRQQLYERLQVQQEQHHAEQYSASSQDGGSEAQQQRRQGQQGVLEQGQRQAVEADEGGSANVDPSQPLYQQQEGAAEAEGVGQEQGASLSWLLRELEREEQQDAAALATEAPPGKVSPGMTSAALRKRAANAHQAAAAAARHAQHAAAAFSTAADATTTAAGSAQRAAAAAARAQVAVERKAAAEVAQAAAQAAQAASQGATAAQRAAVASAKSVMAHYDARKQAQQAVTAAELSEPHTVREKVEAAWQGSRRSIGAAPAAARQLVAEGQAALLQGAAKGQAVVQGSTAASQAWLQQAAAQVRATAHEATVHLGSAAGALRVFLAAATATVRSWLTSQQPPSSPL